MEYWKLGAKTIDSGQRTMSYKRPQRVAKKAVEVPEELTAALAGNAKAKQTFESFPPSCQREYAEWVSGAKRTETRDKRVKQAIEQMAEGKRHNWKYETR